MIHLFHIYHKPLYIYYDSGKIQRVEQQQKIKHKLINHKNFVLSCDVNASVSRENYSLINNFLNHKIGKYKFMISQNN